MKNLRFIFICLFLSGCNGDISAVKNSYIDKNKTTTAAQALNHRDICKNIKWKKIKDDKGRSVVEYSCDFVNTQDFNKVKREKALDDINKAIVSGAENAEKEIKRLKDEYKKISKDRKKIIEERVSSIKAVESFPKGYPSVVSFVKDIEPILKSKDDFALIEVIMSSVFDDVMYAVIYNSNEFGRQGIVSDFTAFKAQVRIMRWEKTPEKQMRYKQDNLERYLKELWLNMPKVKEVSEKWIISQNKIARDNKLAQEERIKELRELYSKQIDDDLKDINRRIEGIKDGRVSDNERIKNMVPLMTKRYPRYDKIMERYQWIVNAEGKSAIYYADIVAVNGDVLDSIYVHSDPERSINMMLKMNTDNYEKYINTFVGRDFTEAIENWRNRNNFN
ncbi:hypothetical protein [Alishewanella longhuensis]